MSNTCLLIILKESSIRAHKEAIREIIALIAYNKDLLTKVKPVTFSCSFDNVVYAANFIFLTLVSTRDNLNQNIEKTS